MSIQYNIKHIQCDIKQPEIDDNENLETESDEETSEEIEYNMSDQNEAEYLSIIESASVSSQSKVAFIAY